MQHKNAHTAVHEWSLGPLLEFLVLEADKEEHIDVGTLLLRIVPNYHNRVLLREFKQYSLTSHMLAASNMPRICDATALQCGTAVFHPVRGMGRISAINSAVELPFTVRFESTETKTYAVMPCIQ